MDARLERQAKNEGLMRTVNDRIATLGRDAGGWAEPEERFDFVCECGEPHGCEERVSMTLAEYERVRRQRDRFAVAPGHETDELERVVERDERFLIVDKRDEVEHLVQ